MAAGLVAGVIYLERRYLGQLLSVERKTPAGPAQMTDAAAVEAAEERALADLATGRAASRRDPLLPSWDGDWVADFAARWQAGQCSVWPSEPALGGLPAGGLGSGGPPQLAPADEARSARSISEAFRPPAAGSASPPGPGPSLAEQPPESAAVRPLGLVGGSGAPVSAVSLAADDAIDLMRRLRNEDQALSAAARRELLRRGFTDVELELARQLVDPDPVVRKQLAQAVPRLQSIDAAPWLMWLCHDSDAEVRMTAITLLATTGDMALLERVEAMARQDSDPRIRDLAEQIARQQSMAASRGGTLK
jgi:hypothetical protein